MILPRRLVQAATPFTITTRYTCLGATPGKVAPISMIWANSILWKLSGSSCSRHRKRRHRGLTTHWWSTRRRSSCMGVEMRRTSLLMCSSFRSLSRSGPNWTAKLVGIWRRQRAMSCFRSLSWGLGTLLASIGITCTCSVGGTVTRPWMTLRCWICRAKYGWNPRVYRAVSKVVIGIQPVPQGRLYIYSGA